MKTNNIKRASPLFSSFSVVRPTQFFGIIKKKRKKKGQSWSLLTLINSFNFKYEHYNNISRHKRFGGVSFLLWNRPSYFPPYWVCFNLVTLSCLACVAGAWKWWAQERTGRTRETRVSVARTFSPATQLYVSLFSSSSVGNPRSYL